jgi:hypothetical protein
MTLPPGLTGLHPAPYNERRWNGAVWANSHVDQYNRELERIATRHRSGMDVQRLVDGLYNLARAFDIVGREKAAA